MASVLTRQRGDHERLDRPCTTSYLRSLVWRLPRIRGRSSMQSAAARLWLPAGVEVDGYRRLLATELGIPPSAFGPRRASVASSGLCADARSAHRRPTGGLTLLGAACDGDHGLPENLTKFWRRDDD